VSRLKEE